MKYDWLGGKVFLQITLWNGAQQMGKTPLSPQKCLQYKNEFLFIVRNKWNIHYFFVRCFNLLILVKAFLLFFYLSYFTTVILLYQVFPLYG